MLSEYLRKKLGQAKYKLLDDGTYFGEIINLRGVWANASNLEDCRNQLREVLEDWLLLKVSVGERVPGFNFKVKPPKAKLLVHA